ncbi:hypothetical protein EYF80_042888 [Liparis tanakae]|uniref:Uncharacterized protein n=1 Tax=Liparis tanakae TaxID=230148 RepID=A0A4Z2G080_9TELE|nr:hypothetical protein EYF80_042888 [Liparis tanakae]
MGASQNQSRYVPEHGRRRYVSSPQSTAAQKRAEGGRPLVNRLNREALSPHRARALLSSLGGPSRDE